MVYDYGELMVGKDVEVAVTYCKDMQHSTGDVKKVLAS
jgi:hypothetical protein